MITLKLTFIQYCLTLVRYTHAHVHTTQVHVYVHVYNMHEYFVTAPLIIIINNIKGVVSRCRSTYDRSLVVGLTSSLIPLLRYLVPAKLQDLLAMSVKYIG